ncbi:ferric reductase-like transmembrane domain-containing protein [Parageobacillus thermoglucosidasius]|uniref:ferric reductase-like transmembrane domain-containing protein n=1 Tax=Parageobacillus thermoglucosidasius TaxID=1426 RepID=UPI000F624808|nr:ferric reductase-like transmembrane domain-containing protein [Parageobacillus thermoglucosidasius]
MITFSTWEWIRASGLSAYFLLFLSVCFGLIQNMNIINRNIRNVLFLMHQTAGWFAFLFAFFHGLLLYFDDYQPFSIREIFIPFLANYQPFFTGLGIIAFYSMFLIFVTTDLMKKVGRNIWKTIHLLILPSFILVSIHGLFIGTDTEETWGKNIYASAIFCFSILTVFRFLSKITVKNNRNRG